MTLRDWVPLPSWWIEEGGLRELRWNKREGADNIAALMTLCVIAHHADARTIGDGETELVASITYDRLGLATGISREKIADGLAVLTHHEVISRAPFGRSTFRIERYNPRQGWCKMPAKKLYSGERLEAFASFNLRVIAELDAMKLYLLFASRRDRASNLARISYDKIVEYSGIERNRLKKAISVLAALGLVYVETTPSDVSDYGVANAYRLARLDSYTHMGTRGRSADADDADAPTLRGRSAIGLFGSKP